MFYISLLDLPQKDYYGRIIYPLKILGKQLCHKVAAQKNFIYKVQEF